MGKNMIAIFRDFLASNLNEIEYFYSGDTDRNNIISLKEYLQLFEERKLEYLKQVDKLLLEIMKYNKWVMNVVPIKNESKLIIEGLNPEFILLNLTSFGFVSSNDVKGKALIDSSQDELLQIFQLGKQVLNDYMDTTSISRMFEVESSYYHSGLTFNGHRLFEISCGELSPYTGKYFLEACEGLEKRNVEYYKHRLIDKVYIKRK